MASSSLVHQVCSYAWVLNAEFDIMEHPQLADPDTNQIFGEYVKGIFCERDPYLAHNMKGTTLISFSMPTNLSSLSNRDVVYRAQCPFDSAQLFVQFLRWRMFVGFKEADSVIQFIF